MFDTIIMPFLMALRYLLLFYAIAILLTVFKIRKIKSVFTLNQGKPDEQKIDLTKLYIFDNLLVRIIFMLAAAIYLYFDLMGFGKDAFLYSMCLVTISLIGFDIVDQHRYKEIKDTELIKDTDPKNRRHKILIKIKKYLAEDLVQIITKLVLIAIALALPFVIKHVINNPSKYPWPHF